LRQPVQFLINDWQQQAERDFIALTPSKQERRDFI
jgi:hypothetical protein